MATEQERKARELAQCSDVMPKTLAEHQEKAYNLILDGQYAVLQALLEEVGKMKVNEKRFKTRYRQEWDKGSNYALVSVEHLITALIEK